MPSKMFSNVWSNNSNINFISICDTFFLTLHKQIMILRELLSYIQRQNFSAQCCDDLWHFELKVKGERKWSGYVFQGHLENGCFSEVYCCRSGTKLYFQNGRTQRQITRNTTSLPNLPCLGIVNAGQFRLQRQLFKIKHSGNVIQGSHYFSKALCTSDFQVLAIIFRHFNQHISVQLFRPFDFVFFNN